MTLEKSHDSCPGVKSVAGVFGVGLEVWLELVPTLCTLSRAVSFCKFATA